MGFLQPFFRADATVVIAIALMVTASFHFLKSRLRSTGESRALEGYLKFCEAFDNVVHFVCIVTVLAFGYTFGWMEMAKLIVVCLVLPVIGHLFALILGTKRWNLVASIIAMPLAVYCFWLVYPHINWFGVL